jgi:diguanylate cyclase (GGDEF)-like protein
VLVVGVTFSATMNSRVELLGRESARAERIRPVLQTFGSWERGLLQLGNGLVDVADASAAERAEYLTHAGVRFNETQAMWNDYNDESLGTRDERRLQEAYSDTYERFSEIGLAALSNTEPNSPEQIAAISVGFDEVAARLSDLREYYEGLLADAVSTTADEAEETQQWYRWGIWILAPVLAVIAVFVIRALRRRDKDIVARAYRTELEARLQRGLEMVHDEGAAYPVTAKAIELSVSDRPAEVLIADSSRAHFHQVVAIDRTAAWSGCSVAAPSECPAAVRGQTQVFDSSTDLDACPHLADRPYGACSAVCVPLSIAGKTVGVVHTTGPDKRPPDADTVATLELIARKAGERVGMLRAFTLSQMQAQTDVLTGLLNRRSLEDRVHELDRNSQRYVVAYADLDHFKMLNDVHGHDIGDRALRHFARILRDSVRPNDIPARYGGEEFVVVLPECDVRDAHAVAERVRSRLATSLVGANIPTFTVSIGIAGYEPTLSFTETVERADAALRTAKQSGRNRTIVADEPVEPQGLEPAEY